MTDKNNDKETPKGNDPSNGDGAGGSPADNTATHQQELAAASQAATDANARADAAGAALLEQTRTANPNVPAALITGGTADEIATSLTTAQATVDQVLDANKPDEKEPPPGSNAAAPPRGDRTPPSNLHGVAKIADALSHPGPGMTE